jgi:molybdate transport system substrate-binding protein
MSWLLSLMALFVGCARSPSDNASALTIAAASDLRYALDETIQRFKQTNPALEIKTAYGSSGSFYAQIQQGAPFDMFLSADMDYPRRLSKAGYAIEGTEFEHSVGRLVVWVRKESPLDVENLGIAALADPQATRVAIANPAFAPYGKAAVAAMQALGVYEKVQERLVLGENVSQTLEFIDSGAAQIGIVAMSLASAPVVKPRGRYWEIPRTAYPRMDQGGIILKSTKNRKGADQLRSFILSREGRAVFKQFGFYMPEDE